MPSPDFSLDPTEQNPLVPRVQTSIFSAGSSPKSHGHLSPERHFCLDCDPEDTLESHFWTGLTDCLLIILCPPLKYCPQSVPPGQGKVSQDCPECRGGDSPTVRQATLSVWGGRPCLHDSTVSGSSSG